MIRAVSAFAGLAAACARDVPVAPTPAPAAALVAAAGTAPRFAFLAPLDSGAADSASFDAAAAPAVEVCVWSGTACTAPPVVRFSTTDTSAQPLTINRAVGRYEGAWNLLDARFRTRQTYRIRVLQAGTEIGGVSVDVVLGRWALTRTDGTLAPLAAATTLPVRFTVRQVTPPPPPPPATCNGGVLRNGLTCRGTITTARQQDWWTFTAAAGDHYDVSVGRDSGAALYPYITVIGPTGAVLSNLGLRNGNPISASGSAPTAGTYTVIVQDQDNYRAGGYQITLALTLKASVMSATRSGARGAVSNP